MSANTAGSTMGDAQGDYAARTCTELQVGISQPSVFGELQPLRTFREAPAYVLLGDAGAGKSTEFMRECRELEDSAKLISARDFVTLEIDPDWNDKTLFIDGLDEMRVGATDSRVPLDEIRRRLQQLELPRFRISCREADWLGGNDRERLNAVAPDGGIRVLRLDPLSESAAADLLAARLGDDEGRDLAEHARRHGIDAMLTNPLTLDLLVEAFADRDGEGPRTRHEVFLTACGRMAQEHNTEHRIGGAKHQVNETLAAAGELCARQLLAGIEGFSLDLEDEKSSFVSVDTLVPISSDSAVGGPEMWASALGTKLFVAPAFSPHAESVRLMPRHRQIAEFLGGRFLGGLIEAGLPAQRVVALLTSPSDSRVVTSLRGLSAWLAAHSSEAFDLLIVADPVGVGLYGDLRGTTVDQRLQILRSLAAEAESGPLMGHQWRDGRESDYRDSTAWAFRSLAIEQTVDAMGELLTDRGDEVASDRIALFLLEVLAAAEADHLRALGVLAPLCEDIARDSACGPLTRRAAIEAYVLLVPAGPERDENLVRLLNDIGDGRVSDPDDEVAGVLLGELYPAVVGPADIWQYLRLRNNNHLYGSFMGFWDRDLRERSSPSEIGRLLDALHDLAAEIVPVLQSIHLDSTSLQLLADALEAFGDQIETQRLFGLAQRRRQLRPRYRTRFRIIGAEKQRWSRSPGLDIEQEELDQ